MKFIKKAAIFTAGLAIFASLAGCSNSTSNKKATSESSTKTVKQTNVTLWAGGSQNVKDGMTKIVSAFNASPEGKKYKLNLEFIMSGTSAASLQDRLVAAKKAGQKKTDYDLILASDAEYSGYTQLGGKDIFLKYDKSAIPNIKNDKATVGAGQGYLLPYRGTTVVLAYDSSKVKNPPKTAKQLYAWIKKHPGKFAYNTPDSGGAGSSFVQTALYNYLPKSALTSSDKKWEAKWDKGFNLLKSLDSYMYKSGGKVVYPNKNQGTMDLLTNGQVEMIPAWQDMTTIALQSGTLPKTIKMTQISPALTGNLDSLVIPSIGSNKKGAEAVMNFMLTKKAQNILVNTMAAIPVINEKEITSSNLKYLKNLSAKDFRFSSIGDLSNDMNQKWTSEIGNGVK
ncbi:extracellular solute-binding protein [Liquorilactobacillus cacaonum]|uniref:ABC transporter substrate-binding protein n=1 Tax=Liquorilactobacillus cacaonum DSM 21116 TaxID=1423729 RepID=A0A0R2CR57_9LACO|nr:extracellular solute-binding protein [Liquorilactobacillus cacaonum]KRM90793.1 hypothetical protein FC80_GL000785 [Liquorilactobacillus cacaonum DSM 21116]